MAYKSVEQRNFESEALKEFLDTSIKFCYGMIASAFRIPTTIRKLKNIQTIGDYESSFEDGSYGLTMGCLSGLSADIFLATYITKEAAKGNYTPLAIWGATNVASGLFELGRLSKSREEYAELTHAEKAAVEKQA